VSNIFIDILGGGKQATAKVKLPDAIIGATAAAYQIPIVTRNPKDFQSDGVDVRVLYDYGSISHMVTYIRPAFMAFRPRPTVTRIK
jgi:hypothetical protein